MKDHRFEPSIHQSDISIPERAAEMSILPQELIKSGRETLEKLNNDISIMEAILSTHMGTFFVLRKRADEALNRVERVHDKNRDAILHVQTIIDQMQAALSRGHRIIEDIKSSRQKLQDTLQTMDDLKKADEDAFGKSAMERKVETQFNEN